MSNYTKSTNFTAKDALSTGNPSKIILGSEHDTEYEAIASAIATKLDITGSAASLTALPAAQGGSLILLDRTVAAAASAVTWNSSIISSTYEKFIITTNNLSFSTTADFWIQFSSDNAVSWIGSSSNVHARFGAVSSNNGATPTIVASTGDSKVIIGAGFTTAYEVCGEYHLDIASTATFTGTTAFFASGVSQGFVNCWGATSATVNGFRFLPSTGTISGNFTIYGIKKA